MKPYGLRSRLNAGEVALGTFVGLKEPALVEIVGNTGYDFVVIDMEHTAIDVADAERLCRAAESVGLAPFVRVPRADWQTAARVIEMGVVGVMAPHICSSDEAQDLVNTVKYPPVGNRGLNVTTRAAGYGAVGPIEHMKQSADETLAVVLIEDREGIDNLEDIFSVEGVDIAITGPADLSRSFGVAGEIRHPLVEEAIDKFMAAAARHQIHVMRSCFAPEDVETHIAAGASLVTSPLSDSHFFGEMLRNAYADVKAYAERGLAQRKQDDQADRRS